MSAIFGASTKWLSGTLTGTVPTPDTNLLLATWYKVGAAVDNDDVLIELKASTESGKLRLEARTGPFLRAVGIWPATTGNADQVSNFTTDTWRLAGGFLPLDDGGFHNVKGWDNGATDTASMGTPNTATESLINLAIGQGNTFNSFSYWKGRLAEASVWIVGSEAEADTIMAALATQTADAITLPAGSTLIGYWPLLGDATATTGAALTDHGTVTFDDTDHPSLTGAGGGGGSNLLLKLQEHGAFL